jgi:hypothetical protein
MRHKFTILSLLSVLVIALGIAVPAYMNREQPPLIGGPFHTPRPTSTRFSEPIIDIVEVVDVEEAQPETNDVITNCTYPIYYWKEYFDSWPSQIIIAGNVYTRADMFTIYNTRNPDTATLLVQELYTAFLNILGGASHIRIDPIIVDANSWLETNPPGSSISEHNQQIGSTLAAALEDYNYGLSGPKLCDDVPPSPTPTPTVTITLTPTETNTPAPPTRIPFTPSLPEPPSDNQSAPPVAPPPPPQSSPTAVVPSPTLPLVPPTAAPTITPQIILPTPTNALPPLPAATNTPQPSASTSVPPTNTSVPAINTSTPPSNTPVLPTEIPTETPEPEAQLLPTRNPHFASPTPP